MTDCTEALAAPEVLMSQEAIDTTHTATLEARFILDLNGQRPLFPWHFQVGRLCQRDVYYTNAANA